MSPPKANTFSYDSGLDAEYPATFRFPVTWSSIAAPLIPEAPHEIVESKIGQPLVVPVPGDQWEMVIPKMARPPSRPAPERMRANIRLPQAEAAPALSAAPASSMLWKLILLAAIVMGFILWAWSRTEAPRPVSLITVDGATRC